MTSAGLAFASLRHRWLRTVVTAMAVMISAAVQVMTISVMTRMSSVSLDFDTDALGVVSARMAFREKIPYAYIDQIRKVPGVKDESKLAWSTSMKADDGQGARWVVWPVSEEFLGYMPKSFVAAQPAAMERWQGRRQGVLVTAPLLERLGAKIGDPRTMRVPIGPGGSPPFANLPVQIEGMLEGYIADSPLMVMHYAYWDQTTRDKGKVGLIGVPCDRKDFNAVSEAIDELFKSSPDPTYTLSWGDLQASVSQSASGSLPDLLVKAGLLIVLVTAVITGSTLYMSLRERQVEFGSLRAIGFSRARIFALVLLESISVCLLGGLAGAAFVYLLFHHNGLNMQGSALTNITASPLGCAVSIFNSILLGFVVGLLPATVVVRQQIIQALAGD